MQTKVYDSQARMEAFAVRTHTRTHVCVLQTSPHRLSGWDSRRAQETAHIMEEIVSN